MFGEMKTGTKLKKRSMKGKRKLREREICTMYSRSMKGSLIATTLAVACSTELRNTIRPIRPNLRGTLDQEKMKEVSQRLSEIV